MNKVTIETVGKAYDDKLAAEERFVEILEAYASQEGIDTFTAHGLIPQFVAGGSAGSPRW